MSTGPRKPRPRSQRTDPQEWPACTRCREHYRPVARWPEGPVCAYCYNAARRREGTCVDCGHIGMVPGLNTAQEPICLSCSKVPLDLTCRGCGQEAWLAKGATCWRCLLREMLTDLLAGPDGTVTPALVPLVEAITSMPRANSGVTWLRANPKVGDLLRDLADGSVALTHNAFDTLPASRSVEYVRGLLVANHALPPREQTLATFQRWLQTKLDTVPDDDNRRVVHRFARWHHLRELRRHAERGPVPKGAFLRAKQSTTVTIEFLAWLSARGRPLDQLTQHDVDAWYAGGTGTREHVERFLYWTQAQRLTGPLQIPRRDREKLDLAGETERLQLIRTMLLEEDVPLPHRVAGCLITLFGLSASRVVALTLDDVELDPDGPDVRLRLAREWLTTPTPLAVLIRRHIQDRANTHTAANANSPWLFPGGMPGAHLDAGGLATALRAAGMPVRATRNTTWQQLVRQAPPQVLADALGISPTTAMRHAEHAGSDWARYAATSARDRHRES